MCFRKAADVVPLLQVQIVSHSRFAAKMGFPAGLLESQACEEADIVNVHVNSSREQRFAIFGLDAFPVEIECCEIERAAKTLDQRHGTGLRALSSESRFLDQVGRDGPVDDSQHPAHQFRAASEQEP